MSVASLSATAATSCEVTATKAASVGYLSATSVAKTFTFTATAAVSQTALAVSNSPLKGKPETSVKLTTSGGSGDGLVEFTVTGSYCKLTGSWLKTNAATTCKVTARKSASTGYLSATSATVDFIFNFKK